MPSFFEALLQSPWQAIVFWIVSVPTIPLYILVVCTIVYRRRNESRFQTTYYNCVLSQALADFIAIPSETGAFILRNMGLYKDFYWEHREFMAPYGYNSNHYLMMLRVFGDCLVSLQRVAVLCYPNSKIHKITSGLALGTIICMHWIPPFVLVLPITLVWNKSFDNRENLLFVVDPNHQLMSSYLEVGYQLIFFTISVVAYSNVFKLVVKHRTVKDLTAEMRLSLVVIGQSVAFAMSLVFYMTQLVGVLMKIKDGMLSVRVYYPLMTGLQSYINPWLHLILNSHLRREMFKIIGLRRLNNATVRSSTGSESIYR